MNPIKENGQDIISIQIMREDYLEIIKLLDILRREMMFQAVKEYEEGNAKKGDELSEIGQEAKCYARSLTLLGQK